MTQQLQCSNCSGTQAIVQDTGTLHLTTKKGNVVEVKGVPRFTCPACGHVTLMLQDYEHAQELAESFDLEHHITDTGKRRS